MSLQLSLSPSHCIYYTLFTFVAVCSISAWHLAYCISLHYRYLRYLGTIAKPEPRVIHIATFHRSILLFYTIHPHSSPSDIQLLVLHGNQSVPPSHTALKREGKFHTDPNRQYPCFHLLKCHYRPSRIIRSRSIYRSFPLVEVVIGYLYGYWRYADLSLLSVSHNSRGKRV